MCGIGVQYDLIRGYMTRRQIGNIHRNGICFLSAHLDLTGYLGLSAAS